MRGNFLRLLVILLGFSYVISASAIPATRTQNLNREDTPALPSLATLGNGEEVLADMEDEEFVERRMDLETQDYGGTEANRNHDPKSPGRV